MLTLIAFIGCGAVALTAEQAEAILTAAASTAAPRTFDNYGAARRLAEDLDRPLLVITTSESCSACVRLKRLTADRSGFVVCELDVAKSNPFGVTAVPSQHVVYAGVIKARASGCPWRTSQEYESWLKSVFTSSRR